MAYPTQFRLSAAPCVSQVFEDCVINILTHCTLTGSVANCNVATPPWPSLTTPLGNACHTPSVGFLIGSSPVQYWTSYCTANGCAHAIRIAVTCCGLAKSRKTHCGWAVSLSPVKGCVKYGLLFQ